MTGVRITDTADEHIEGFNAIVGIVARERLYKRAKALYEKLGFVHEGVRRRARKLDGRYDDDVLMALFAPGLEENGP